MNALALKELKQEFRRMRVEADFFEFPKRGRSPVKKKATVPPTVPPTPDPLVPV